MENGVKTKKQGAFLPREVRDLDMAFGNIQGLMPDRGFIPQDFERNHPELREIVAAWFFEGLNPEIQFVPKEGIDAKKAFRHLKTIMGSFATKHEHKTEAICYLMAEWFAEIKNWKKA